MSELERLRAEVERLRAANARLNAETATFCDRLQAAHEERDNAAWEAANLASDNVQLQEERDRLRAVLADTPETLRAMADAWLTAQAGPVHADTCEAEVDHPHDCATATRLAQLTAFAEAVRDAVNCASFIPVVTDDEEVMAQQLADHMADCLHCAALQALEPPR